MSVKNFKISTGLDLEGLILTTANAQLLINGNALATESYVTNALTGVDTDLSNNAGSYLSWNSGTSQFDVNIEGIADDLVSQGNFALTTDITTALTGYVTETGQQTLSNKTFSDAITLAGTGAFTITGSSDIVLASGVGHSAYLGSVTANNEIVTMGNVPAGYTNSDVDAYLTGGDGIAYSQGNISIELDPVSGLTLATGLLAVDTNTIATQSYVGQQGFLTSGDLTGYATETYVNGQGFLVASDISGKQNSFLAGTGLDFGDGTTLSVDTSVIATRAYADGIAQGLDIKASVQVSSVTNINIANPGTTIDGVTLTNGDRVLIKDQTDTSENGIYSVSGSPIIKVLTRTDDAILGTTLTKGSFTFVEHGTHAGHGFVCTNVGDDPVFDVQFTQFSDSAAYITSASAPFSVTSGVLELSKDSAFSIDGSNQLTTNDSEIAHRVREVLISNASYLTNSAYSDLDVNVSALATELTTNQGIALAADAYTDADAVDAVQAALGAGLTSAWGPALEDLIAVNYGDGITLGQSNEIKVNIGSGISLGASNELTVDFTGYVTETGTQDLSNKRIINTLYFTDGVTVSDEGQIGVFANTHEFEIMANYGDLTLKTVATDGMTGSNVNISSLYGDIVLTTPAQDKHAYIGSVAAGNEIATKSYVDDLAAGLDVKASVKVATTASLVEGGGPLGGGTNPWTTTPGVSDPTIDGVTLAAGDRVLVKNDYDGSNGIYEVTSPVANYYMLERTADGIIDDTLTKGAFVFVEGGTNAGKGFVAQIYAAPPAFGGSGSSVSWSQFSEAGSFITSVDTNQGWSVNSGQLSLDYGSGLTVVSGHLGVNEQRHVTVDDEYNWRSVKVARHASWSNATETCVVTIPASSQYGEMVVRMGQRISKLMVALDEWTEYAIVDRENSSPEATVDVFYDSPNGNFIITGYNETGYNMTVVADFII